jgi:predicted Zn finger-like uncharacterized protein
MSLATRCAACGTVFRVVQDQLRVSSGWVRCGRCGEVFNAIDSLVDLEVDRPGDDAAPSAHRARIMEDLARVAGAPAWPQASRTLGAGRAEDDDPGPGAQGSPGGPQPEETDGRADADVDVGAAQPGEADAASSEAAKPRPEPASGSQVAAPGGNASRAPAFVRRAERAARWRRPGVRVALGVASMAAAAVLAWQVHLTHHDWVGARWPALKPVVERACLFSGCSLEAPRRIESLAVESSGLTRDAGGGAYRLSLVLRNRESIPVRMPAVDLALTDAQGQLIARRVLDARALGFADEQLEGLTDQPLAATLRVGPDVVGYTIELFYP